MSVTNPANPAAPSGNAFNEIKALLTGLTSRLDAQDAEIKRLSQPAAPSQYQQVRSTFGAPHVREGEDPLGSRGYSYLKAFGFAAGQLRSDHAKVEIDLHNRLQKSYVDHLGYEKGETNSLMMPFSTVHMLLEEKDPSLLRETRQLVQRGVSGVDWDEVRYYRERHWPREKALSWIDESVGGSLVAPPQMGELIELLRNNCALLNAGARDVGMPPQGRITMPRQTSSAISYIVGESNPIPDSTPGTGDLTLRAHKLGCLVKIPNELFRFATVAVEQFVREDISQSMAIKMDKVLLEHPGSSIAPKGLINFANINKVTAAGVAAVGNTIEANDIGKMIIAVEEANASFESWIMRPTIYSSMLNRRTDGPMPGDKKGPFLFNMLRDYTAQMNRGRGRGMLEGYPVVKSTNVSNARSNGTANTLSYVLGGDFRDYIMALSGVIEFVVAKQGDSMVVQDQTWVRGLQYFDGAPRHEASFVLMDNLLRDQS